MLFEPGFLSLAFIVLLAGTAVLRIFVPDRLLLPFGTLAAILLLALSTSWPTAALGTALTLLVIHPIAQGLARAKAGSNAARARLLLGIGVVIILALWVFVKVTREIRPHALQDTRVSEFLIATIGFSYFIFRAINYLWMHYLIGASATGTQGPVRLLYYLLFPSTISAGPIHKWLEFSREVDAKRRLTLEDAGIAIERITRGYFYTIVLGRVCYEASRALLPQAPATQTDALTAAAAAPALHAWESLAILLANHLYLFFDFAGLSSLAIGFGMLLGIKVPENFRLPFHATTMAEFWRNWHITLGDWFRDHVFVPLGGMKRQGLYPALIAALIMFLSGLWHGFVWHFALWGCWHALMIFIDGAMGLKPIPPADRQGPHYWARLVWTNLRVALGSLLFLPSPHSNAPLVLEGFLRW